jgi:CDGSH-type Zn-finger protein
VLIEDSEKGGSGRLRLRVGVQVIGPGGFAREVRDRVTSCRSGASRDKPFCDGSRVPIGLPVAASPGVGRGPRAALQPA